MKCNTFIAFVSSLLLATPVFAHPSHGHLHQLYHDVSKAKRDAESTSVCPPIPDKLEVAADLIAKVRLESGEVCEADAKPALYSLMSADLDDPYSCSQIKPCSNGACCAKTGVCGYGPEACGTNDESPNGKCWSNCDAHAECGRFAASPGKECPLKVCCSQHGFCGMTTEYCDESDEEDEGCQSNCDQPGSGGSGGDVQKRIIGYYEAWNAKKKCIGMSMEDIPVNSLTHIYYSFAYIEPETFEIIPMRDDKDGDLTTESFTEFAALKRKNPSLSVVVALGGWTFNDNNTIWQPVFSDLCSTKQKRVTFIDEVLKFLNRYGFDGVDIDWEYPGAGDRGGKPEDGENFTKLLQEMRVEFDKTPGGHKEISFTAPTSYWYMRHFDITATAEAVDYINVMSYDLHGIWDANNPIGSQVLAHTNLTEIELALNLFWRNDVEASKINLGLGFYGRSFQLADPACHEPGCLFLGGAAPGPCTDNSGTLSYFEIMDIVDQNNLSPYWDKDSGVKYITWNEDQWVSYDDQDTFQQKIKFANSLGLGGLLIWAIDLDTQNLDALSGVLYPDGFGAHKDWSTTDPWEELGEGYCTVSKCGSTGCSAGNIEVNKFNCNRFEGKKKSVCCPFASAPDPDKCTWRGNGHYCNGQCHDGEVAIASSTQVGSGSPCLDGRKFLCCEAEAKVPDCHWTGCKEDCASDENELTWKHGSCSGDNKKKFCCSKDQDWKNCKWHGKPGSCFDNHCDTGWQVSLTRSHGGEDETCGWASSRKRSFCCDPPEGASPFLPVPLDYLFPDPPDEEGAESDWTLKVDNTWGGSEDLPFAETPESSAFGFVVMTSPEEIQVSLDRRDGSHWDVFDCFDSTTEKEHTVRMVCASSGEDSNCDKIHLGHGARGTIIDMPSGCGPGRYAVVKEMNPSSNQSLPHHISRRDLSQDTTVYDLTFDYDFRRVPRDLGDTQIRIDYSNENTYWDTIVDKAADQKKRNAKRSPRSFNGNHKRWLEEEWRDDVHYGALSKEEIHKRWFGETVLDWLKELFDGVTNTADQKHEYNDEFTLSIIDQDWVCPNMRAKLDVSAVMKLDMDVNYGFTLIARLGGEYGIDISDSYLYYRTGGEVSAKFVVDAAATVHFDTEDRLMFSADTFGAAFTVPGIVTVGPNFKLYGRLEGEATLGVNFETSVKIAEWSVYQTYPAVNEDWEPGVFQDPDKSNSISLEPEFEYGVSLDGYLTAHVKPTITFGIDFNKDFATIDSCLVELVADGHVTFHAEAETGSGGSSFCYGVDVGADIYATVEAPDVFSWALPKTPYMIFPVHDVTVFPSPLDGDACSTSGGQKLLRRDLASPEYGSNETSSLEVRSLSRRAERYGPLFPRIEGLSCPGDEETGEMPPCPLCWNEDETGLATREEGEVCWLDPYRSGEKSCSADAEGSLQTSSLSKRASKQFSWVYNGGQYSLYAPDYPDCEVAKGTSYTGIKRYYGFLSTQPSKSCDAVPKKLNIRQLGNAPYVTEHVYEGQLLKRFMRWLHNDATESSIPLPSGYSRPSNIHEWVSEVLLGCDGKVKNRKYTAPGWDAGDSLWQAMADGLGGKYNLAGLALTDERLNGRKGNLFGGDELNRETLKNPLQTRQHQRAGVGVFYYMRDTDIWGKFVDSSKHMERVLRVFDDNYPWGQGEPMNDGEIGIPTRQIPRPGLRDLYCYWIDQVLAKIEQEGVSWIKRSKETYTRDFKYEQGSQDWINVALRKGGPISEDKIFFPPATPTHRGPASPPVIWKNSNYRDLWDLGAAGPF